MQPKRAPRLRWEQHGDVMRLVDVKQSFTRALLWQDEDMPYTAMLCFQPFRDFDDRNLRRLKSKVAAQVKGWYAA